jgi:transposase
MTQPAIAESMGVSRSTVNRAHMAYDHGGLKALRRKPSGGRKRENMPVAEEKALLARFAKAAGAGEMLNIHDLKVAYEKAIGHETSNSTVYNLLIRHGWRKLMPRPFHPKRDIAAQNAFKKRVPQCCQESPAGCRQAWPSLAHHVRRRSALRSDEPPATVLGTHRHPPGGRLPAHS